jgi:fructokinase
MDIVCLGELLIDMFPVEIGRNLTEVSSFRPKPGGAPANVAVAASRLGAQSAFIGKVGNDAFGYFLADILRQEGVNIRGIRYDDKARTSMNFMAQPDPNTYTCLFYRNPGADMLLLTEELDRGLLRQTRAFHFGSISLIQEPSRSATLEAIRIARKAGAIISFDVNFRPTLWGSPEDARNLILSTMQLVDLVKVNEFELSMLTKEENLDFGSIFLMEKGPELCVVTLGPEGSYFHVAEGSDKIDAFEVEAVDATGCGDAFVAGLLWRLLSGGDWRIQLRVSRMQEILRYANAVGALTALKQGVIPALPNSEDVDTFLVQREFHLSKYQLKK